MFNMLIYKTLNNNIMKTSYFLVAYSEDNKRVVDSTELYELFGLYQYPQLTLKLLSEKIVNWVTYSTINKTTPIIDGKCIITKLPPDFKPISSEVFEKKTKEEINKLLTEKEEQIQNNLKHLKKTDNFFLEYFN